MKKEFKSLVEPTHGELTVDDADGESVNNIELSFKNKLLEIRNGPDFILVTGEELVNIAKLILSESEK